MMPFVLRSETAGVLTLAIDHPPVNTLATVVRQGLLDAVMAAQADQRIHAVVITGKDAVFSAGADLHEFAQGTAMDFPSVHAHLAEVLLGSNKPVIAAINGLALGGGLELAMWCHARVAVTDAKLGLPETTLGLMPGAGGTQLLPRAIGLTRALDMVVKGHVVLASTLAGTPLLDQICSAETLLSCSHRLGLALFATAAPYPHLSRLQVEVSDTYAQLNTAHDKAMQSGGLSDGRLKAIESMARCFSVPFPEAIAMEHDAFRTLLNSHQAQVIRDKFLSLHTRKP